jgi:hypothetical protein
MIRVFNSSEFRSGDWVEVRSKGEILATLDSHGQLENLPFMPEMFEFCGKRFRVYKRAHKTCDPPNGLQGRRMLRTVHLEDVQCNGAAHDGCQARCLIFWKDAWLKKVDGPSDLASIAFVGASMQLAERSELPVWQGTRDLEKEKLTNEPVFVCQSTQISRATVPLKWWDLSQYVEDYLSGNVGLLRLFMTFAHFVFSQLVSSGLGVGSVLRWSFDKAQKARGRTPYPFRPGRIRTGEKTPSAQLKLQPGELVRVRDYEDILATLDGNAHNRGMYFDAEMVPYCGGTYRVLDRITRIINEKTGKMLILNNDCIMLEKVICNACYSKFRRFCPRSIYPYWREIWLERVDPDRKSEQPKLDSSKAPTTS